MLVTMVQNDFVSVLLTIASLELPLLRSVLISFLTRRSAVPTKETVT